MRISSLSNLKKAALPAGLALAVLLAAAGSTLYARRNQELSQPRPVATVDVKTDRHAAAPEDSVAVLGSLSIPGNLEEPAPSPVLTPMQTPAPAPTKKPSPKPSPRSAPQAPAAAVQSPEVAPSPRLAPSPSGNEPEPLPTAEPEKKEDEAQPAHEMPADCQSLKAVDSKRVCRGDLVGHEGATGNATGPHVHFECRWGNKAVNCQPYVNNGTLTYPISGFTITQHFGECGNTSFYSCHTGMDLAGPYGTPVHAPADGTVILNKWFGAYGNTWAEQLDNGLIVLLGQLTGK